MRGGIRVGHVLIGRLPLVQRRSLLVYAFWVILVVGRTTTVVHRHGTNSLVVVGAGSVGDKLTQLESANNIGLRVGRVDQQVTGFHDFDSKFSLWLRGRLGR